MTESRDDRSTESSAFAERVAALLRRPERLDRSFDERVMRRVEVEASGLYARTPVNEQADRMVGARAALATGRRTRLAGEEIEASEGYPE